MELKKLFVNYEIMTKDSVNQFLLASCRGDINDWRAYEKKHSITKDEFSYILDAFWRSGSYYVKPISVSEIRGIVDNNPCESFVKFNPTDAQRASDISYEIIPNNDYNEIESCFGVALFKAILGLYEEFIDSSGNFYFTKGKKWIIRENTSRVIKTVVTFIVELSDGRVLFYDIADDPTIRLKESVSNPLNPLFKIAEKFKID